MKLIKIRTIFAIFTSKLTIKLLRLFKLGGTTLPGKIALKLSPSILTELSSNLDVIIVVTGTNGKTTTCRMISQIFDEENIDFFTNKSGANLTSGILTTLIENSSLSATFIKKTALFEVDEAAFGKIAGKINPHFVLVTNFFRDQLDRFGELYTTVQTVKDGINSSKDPTLIINANDSLSVSIAKDTNKNVVYYGLSSNLEIPKDNLETSDANFCIYCKTKYSYDYKIFGHLGGFRCENCNFKSPSPNLECSKIEELTDKHSKIEITLHKTPQDYKQSPTTAETLNRKLNLYMYHLSNVDIPTQYETLHAKINLPGIYNIYNALSASALSTLLNIHSDKISKGLETFKCGFGRMETITVDNKNINLVLVKNPTGFNQVLSFLLSTQQNKSISFLINDNLADGTDISWLWDVNFEMLTNASNLFKSFICSGKRRFDMALRLKYAGVEIDKIKIIKEYEEVIETGLRETQDDCTFYILPTYTALLDVRSILSKNYELKEFWR